MPEKIDIYKEDSGKIFKEILETGDGELIAIGASVKVHYTGYLLDGTKFDSSEDRHAPFQCNVGVGEVIAGWDIGICSMRKGEHAILTIDSKYAYGAEGNPPAIKPNAVLKFNVKILDWAYEDLSPNKDGTIQKRHTSEKGSGYLSPAIGAYVQMHIIGKHNSEVFEDRDVIFRLNLETHDKIALGVKGAIQKFKMGEKSTLFLSPRHVCNIDFPIQGGIVEYDIQLKCFERLEKSWSMDEDDKIRVSEMFKEKGNQYFKGNEYNNAIKLYQKILKDILEKDGDPIKKNDEDCIKLILSTYLNLSLCFLRIEEYEQARDSAFKAISLSSNNDKAHYRYAQALLALSEYEEAKEHFEICLTIDPKNSEAKSQISKCMANMQKSADTEKKRYQNMFKKFSEFNVKKEDEEQDKS